MPPAPDRLVATGLALERRLANPLVATILRSPLHARLSRRLLLLAYEGRRSGRYYETPVCYRKTDDGLVLLTAPSTTWWRNFEAGHPASVLLRGQWRDGVGRVVSDEAAACRHLRWLVGPIRRASRRLIRIAVTIYRRNRRPARGCAGNDLQQTV